MVKNPPAVQATQLWDLGWEEPLEKRIATHSSMLSWRIPWTEESGALQSMGLQRVGALVVLLCDDRHLSTPQILITRSPIANTSVTLVQAASSDCSCIKPLVYMVTFISLSHLGRLLWHKKVIVFEFSREKWRLREVKSLVQSHPTGKDLGLVCFQSLSPCYGLNISVPQNT